MSSTLGDIYHKNRVLKGCLEHLTYGSNSYMDSMLNTCYFHPGGVNYCVLHSKEWEDYR